MNRPTKQRTIDDLSWQTAIVCKRQRKLREYAASDDECRVFRYENLTRNILALRDLCEWLEIDYTPTVEDLATIINATEQPKFEWTPETTAIFEHVAERFEHKG